MRTPSRRSPPGSAFRRIGGRKLQRRLAWMLTRPRSSGRRLLGFEASAPSRRTVSSGRLLSRKGAHAYSNGPGDRVAHPRDRSPRHDRRPVARRDELPDAASPRRQLGPVRRRAHPGLPAIRGGRSADRLAAASKSDRLALPRIRPPDGRRVDRLRVRDLRRSDEPRLVAGHLVGSANEPVGELHPLPHLRVPVPVVSRRPPSVTAMASGRPPRRAFDRLARGERHRSGCDPALAGEGADRGRHGALCIGTGRPVSAFRE